MRLALLNVIIFLASCNSQDNKSGDKITFKDSLIHSVTSNTSLSFFDSVMRKLELTHEQITAHTNLDSVYYITYNKEATFRGDTILKMAHHITGVIINYSDALVCSKTILFIFLPGSGYSSDYKEIDENCDRELSMDYYYTDYRLLGDSGIVSTEFHLPPEKDDGSDTAKVSQVLKLVVNPKGTIDTLSIRRFEK